MKIQGVQPAFSTHETGPGVNLEAGQGFVDTGPTLAIERRGNGLWATDRIVGTQPGETPINRVKNLECTVHTRGEQFRGVWAGVLDTAASHQTIRDGSWYETRRAGRSMLPRNKAANVVDRQSIYRQHQRACNST